MKVGAKLMPYLPTTPNGLYLGAEVRLIKPHLNI